MGGSHRDKLIDRAAVWGVCALVSLLSWSINRQVDSYDNRISALEAYQVASTSRVERLEVEARERGSVLGNLDTRTREIEIKLSRTVALLEELLKKSERNDKGS